MAPIQVRGYHLNNGDPNEIFSTINADDSLNEGIQQAKKHCLLIKKAVTCLLFSPNNWNAEKIANTKEKIWEALGDNWTFSFEQMKKNAKICVITIINTNE